MKHQPYYIITGPPSSGKTTLINELLKANYHCYQEMARIVIQENLKEGVDCFPWKNNVEFSHQVFVKITDLLNSLNGDFCFFDRSIVDLIAYMDVSKSNRNKNYIDTIYKSPYNRNVFFLPFWDEIYTNDNERKESKEEAILIEKSLRDVYSEFGFQIIDVPISAIDLRIDFILNKVNSF